jgi:hypothetical protein
MELFEQLMEAIPELSLDDFHPHRGTILLQNDSDGLGTYIREWNYSKPIPKGFKLGK